MNKQWFFAIKSGAKFWEFRRASSWKARCDGATHALFRLGPLLALLLKLSLKVGKSRGLLEDIWFPLLVSLAILGYTKTQIGPTKILEMRTLTVEEARELGCPVENKDYFDGGEIIGLRFEPFKESLPCCVLSRLAPNMGVDFAGGGVGWDLERSSWWWCRLLRMGVSVFIFHVGRPKKKTPQKSRLFEGVFVLNCDFCEFIFSRFADVLFFSCLHADDNKCQDWLKQVWIIDASSAFNMSVGRQGHVLRTLRAVQRQRRKHPPSMSVTQMGLCARRYYFFLPTCNLPESPQVTFCAVQMSKLRLRTMGMMSFTQTDSSIVTPLAYLVLLEMFFPINSDFTSVSN